MIADQRAYFDSGVTRPYQFRVEQLRRLKAAIQEWDSHILTALAADLGKSSAEAYMSEVGVILQAIGYSIKHLKSWMKPERVPTPITLFGSSSHIYREPLGLVLIISPWNYPFHLCMAPLIGAIAAGNCAVIKPSEHAPRTAQLVADILAEVFEPRYVTVVQGGIEVSQDLLACKWDHIFFTGGTEVGRIVARAAAEHLTPVTLELGGKSPCIVDAQVDLEVTARRIAWGKFFNAGQTCIAPDYLLVHNSVKKQLLNRLQHEVQQFYGPDPAISPDYARIINDAHFNRLQLLLDAGSQVTGGQSDPATRYIAPTVLDEVSLDHPIMAQEIFGPILPVLGFDNLDQAIEVVRRNPNPLALYLFTKSDETERRILAEIPFGGGCLNHTMVHFSSSHLPFGGVGNSGDGAYHGRYSFERLSHRKSVVKAPWWLDLRLIYPPYKGKLGLVRRLLK